MPNFSNSLFNIKFTSGKERTLSRMDSDEAKEFLEDIGRVTYQGQFVCAAYWCDITNSLDISHENELSTHLKKTIEALMD